MPENNELQYLSASDINKIYGIGTSTLWRWTREGNFPEPVRIGNHWTRWKREQVDAFMDDSAKKSRKESSVIPSLGM